MLETICHERGWGMKTGLAAAIAWSAGMAVTAIAEPPAGVVELDLGIDQTTTDAASAHNRTRPTLVAVVASGVGETPDSARQNAFSNAIEQVVGALVEAETIVKNDRMVRDQVLTYSRGYVEDFEVIGTWEEGGLHYCRIRADVSAAKLGEKLNTVNVALRELPGQMFAHQIIQQQLSEEAARQMFRKATADFTPDKLLKLAVLGKPEVERTDAGARLNIHYTVTADLKAWEHIRANLKPLLDRVCEGKTSLQVASNQWGRLRWDFAAALPRTDCHSYLYSGKSPEGNVTYFDAYALPAWMEAEIAGIAARHANYQIRIVLLDEADRVVAQALVPAGRTPLIVRLNTKTQQYRSSSMAPLSYSSRQYVETLESTQVFQLTLDQVGQVAKCAAMWTGGPE